MDIPDIGDARARRTRDSIVMSIWTKRIFMYFLLIVLEKSLSILHLSYIIFE